MHNWQRKLISYSLLISIIGVQFLGFFAFAQETNEDPVVCFQPSEEFKMFTNFSSDILAVLNTVGSGDTPVRQINMEGELFTYKFLKWSAEGGNYIMRKLPLLTQGVDRAINAGLSAGLASFYNLREGMSKDAWLSFTVLFKKKPFVRDMETLMDIDGAFQMQIFELSLKGKLHDNIDSNHLQALQTLTKRYSGENKFFSTLQFGSDAKYINIIQVMIKLIGYMKYFIGTYSKENTFFVHYLDSKEPYLKPVGKGIYIIPNKDTIVKMTQAYLAVRNGGSCSIKLKDVLKKLSQVKKIGKDFQHSIENIEQSIAKLKSTLQDAKNKYGKIAKGKDEEGEKQNPVLGFLRDKIAIKSNGLSSITDQFSTRIKWVENNYEDYKNKRAYEKAKERLKTLDEAMAKINPTQRKNKLKDVLKRINKGTIIEQERLNILTASSNIIPLTNSIYNMCQSTQETLKSIGSKDKKQSLTEGIVTLCNKQCTNKPGPCSD